MTAGGSSADASLDSLVTRLVLAASGVVLLLLTYSLGGGEWMVGVAVHAGNTRMASVGLGQVKLQPMDTRRYPDYVSLHDLCVQNYSRSVTMPLSLDGQPDFELLETPHDTWCAFELAGARTASLLGMAWLPVLLRRP